MPTVIPNLLTRGAVALPAYVLLAVRLRRLAAPVRGPRRRPAARRGVGHRSLLGRKRGLAAGLGRRAVRRLPARAGCGLQRFLPGAVPGGVDADAARAVARAARPPGVAALAVALRRPVAISSSLLALLFGVALGNLLRGVPTGGDGWFTLPLFTSSCRARGRPARFYTVLIGSSPWWRWPTTAPCFWLETAGDLNRRTHAVARVCSGDPGLLIRCSRPRRPPEAEAGGAGAAVLRHRRGRLLATRPLAARGHERGAFLPRSRSSRARCSPSRRPCSHHAALDRRAPT